MSQRRHTVKNKYQKIVDLNRVNKNMISLREKYDTTAINGCKTDHIYDIDHNTNWSLNQQETSQEEESSSSNALHGNEEFNSSSEEETYV